MASELMCLNQALEILRVARIETVFVSRAAWTKVNNATNYLDAQVAELLSDPEGK